MTDLVTCSTCLAFTRDQIGSGAGLGDCGIKNAEGQENEIRSLVMHKGEVELHAHYLGLWPEAERICKQHRKTT